MLRRALLALGIEPFNRDDVARYQRAQISASARGWRWTAIMSTAATLVAAAAIGWNWGGVMVHGLTAIPLILSVFGFVGMAGTGYVRWLAPAFTAEWTIELISLTQAPVPAFALQTALDLHKAVPSATVSVSRFRSREEVIAQRRSQRMEAERLRRADPFLVVEFGDYTAYIEVWDEPDFEGRRKA